MGESNNRIKSVLKAILLHERGIRNLSYKDMKDEEERILDRLKEIQTYKVL